MRQGMFDLFKGDKRNTTIPTFAQRISFHLIAKDLHHFEQGDGAVLECTALLGPFRAAAFAFQSQHPGDVVVPDKDELT